MADQATVAGMDGDGQPPGGGWVRNVKSSVGELGMVKSSVILGGIV